MAQIYNDQTRTLKQLLNTSRDLKENICIKLTEDECQQRNRNCGESFKAHRWEVTGMGRIGVLVKLRGQ